MHIGCAGVGEGWVAGRVGGHAVAGVGGVGGDVEGCGLGDGVVVDAEVDL